jgi:glycogen(starch) synthase
VIPNGIDSEDLAHVEDLELLRAGYAAPNERMLLLVGRLVYEKGFQLALAALPRLLERLPDLRVVVAGSGPHEASLRAQARDLGLLERVRFLGWIGDDVLHALYRVADLCVVPSIYEPFGLVALEAMASGCPCVVADTGGLREVVPHEEVGLRFTASDPVSLAEMVERLLTDDALRGRLVAEAASHVRGFDWNDIAGRTAALYRELVAGRV